MKKNRLLTFILAGIMLTSVCACDGGTDTDGDITDTVTETEANLYPAGIEPCNYNMEFHVLAPAFGLYNDYFFNDGEQADAMDKAIYERELAVEEHLGIDITYEINSDGRWNGIDQIRPAVQQMVMSGDDTYQLVLTHCINGVQAMITEELLLDMNTIDINFEGEWWNHIANKNLSVKDKQFYAVSDYMIADPNAVLFNKQMIDEYNLDDPYELVRDGEWTIDKMMEMMEAVTVENGDSRWDINDQYGFAAPDNWNLTPFIYSSGLTLLDKNDEGEFAFVFDTPRVYDFTEKLHTLFHSDSTFIYSYNNNVYDETTLDIDKGRSLFNIMPIHDLYLLRDSKVEYGILPYPKLDDMVDGYYTNDWSGMMCVPLTAQNTDMIAKAIDLLGYYSMETTVPAYYDLVLGAKLSRDDDSREMLSIIFDGIIFDAGMNYMGFSSNFNQFLYSPHHISADTWSGFASHLAKYQPGVVSELDAFNEAVANLD